MLCWAEFSTIAMNLCGACPLYICIQLVVSLDILSPIGSMLLYLSNLVKIYWGRIFISSFYLEFSMRRSISFFYLGCFHECLLHCKVPLSQIVTSSCTIIVGHCFHITFVHLKILLQHNIAIHDYSVV